MNTPKLFPDRTGGGHERIGPAALILRGFALDETAALLRIIAAVTASAPFRQMQTPGGRLIAVQLSNCGSLGWISDHRGYRYSPLDPLSGAPWPALPADLVRLAQTAAAAAGFARFTPDACLINRYLPGTRLSLHQDKDERDFSAPIVSISLGMQATFLFGGLQRADKARKIPLYHGDVAVWGGPDRLRYHGIAPLNGAPHPQLGSLRLNLTLRQAG